MKRYVNNMGESKLYNTSDYNNNTLMKLMIAKGMISLVYSLENKLDKDFVKRLIADYNLNDDDKKKKK